MKKTVVAKKQTSKKPASAKVSPSTPKPVQTKPKKAKGYANIKSAFFAFQGEKLVLPRNGQGKSNGGKPYKYVTLDDLIDRVIPVLQKYGLGFTQVVMNEKLLTELFHADSNTSLTISEIMLGKPESVQDYGGRITYTKRYALTALLGLSAEEDIDAAGQAATTLTAAPVTTAAAAPINNGPSKTTAHVYTLDEQIANLEEDVKREQLSYDRNLENPENTLEFRKSMSNHADKIAMLNRDLSSLKLRKGGNKEVTPALPDTHAEKSALPDTNNDGAVKANPLEKRMNEMAETSKWFKRARSAIESCGDARALEVISEQVAKSASATDEEKALSVELINEMRKKFA